jgi:uncharacterized membrane protein YfcA
LSAGGISNFNSLAQFEQNFIYGNVAEDARAMKYAPGGVPPMPSLPIEPYALLLVLSGAFVAGFTSGFAGFGTGLVASGLWFHALPAAMVPPLIVVASVAGQLVGLVAVRRAFEWRRAWPFIAGGLAGVPQGVLLLSRVSPELLKLCVGLFLVAYVLARVGGIERLRLGDRGGRAADAAVGVGGGILGGFAGLSAPLPLIWLQLRGGPSDRQRAVYQPFNLVVLVAACVGMAVGGQIDAKVAVVCTLCLPVTVAGAVIGTRAYLGIGEQAFHRIVLALLLGSGATLVLQTLLRA